MQAFQVEWGFQEMNSPSFMSSNYVSNYDKQIKMFSSKEKADIFISTLENAANILGIRIKFYVRLHDVKIED